MNTREVSFSNSQHPKNYKARDFSTADKYSNLELTAQRMEGLLLQNDRLKDCLHSLGVPTDRIARTDRPRAVSQFSAYGARNEIEEWNLRQRGQYLEKKVEKLKQDKIRQGKALEKIKNSEKWQNRGSCNSCYVHKYIRYLKLTCPDTEF